MPHKQSEEDIVSQIIEYLKKRGLFHWRDKQVRTKPSQKGWHFVKGVADLHVVHKGRHVSIEVKSQRGVLSQAQFDWSQGLGRAGGVYIIASSVEELDRKLRENGI